MCLPTKLFFFFLQEKLDQLFQTQTTISGFDFSGLDQLTDEAFFVLKDKFKPSEKKWENVKSINCTGCLHITDYGLVQAIDAFPNLEQVKVLFR